MLRLRAQTIAHVASRRPPTSRPLPPRQIEPGPGRNLLERPIPLTTKNEDMVESIGSAGRFAMAARTDHYMNIVFAPRPAFQRFDLRTRFHLAPIEGAQQQPADFARGVTIGFFDRDKPIPGDIVYSGLPGGFFGAALWIDDEGDRVTVSVYHGAGGEEVMHRPIQGVKTDLSEAVTMRLVRDGGGSDEVYVNDQPIYTAPSAVGGPTPNFPGIYIKAIGARANHGHIALTEPPGEPPADVAWLSAADLAQ